MAMHNFSDEQLLSLVSENIPVSEMAIRLGVDYEDLFAHYAACSADNRKAYPLTLLITESWLSTKMATTPIAAISREAMVSPSVIRRLAKQYGIQSKLTVRQILSGDVLHALYVGQGYTDKAIAAQYGCSVELVKQLRKQHGISPDDRYAAASEITIEFFHRLYVTYGFTEKQLMLLFDCTKYHLMQMIRNFSMQGHPLSCEIENRRKGRYSLLISALMEKLEPALILEQLKTKTLAELAELYGIIPPPEPGVETFSAEWLAALLKKMDVEEIKRKYFAGPLLISSLMEEGNLQPISPMDRLDEAVVRKLYLEQHWQDAQIAELVGIAASTVRTFRMQHNIWAADRFTLAQRLPSAVFERLYLQEGMTVAQIASLYGVPVTQVRNLKKEYAEINPAIASQKSHGVTEDRMQYFVNELRQQGLS